MGSRLILSSGFTIRRVCYARAISHRFSKRRRRDRRRANVIIGADISSDSRNVKSDAAHWRTVRSCSKYFSPVAFSPRK